MDRSITGWVLDNLASRVSVGVGCAVSSSLDSKLVEGDLSG